MANTKGISKTAPLGIPEVDKIIEAQRYGGPETSLKFKLEDRSPKQCRISQMPNQVLHFIISLLTMKEGVATGILSRRWRNLWSSSVSRLNFNPSSMEVEKCFKNKPEEFFQLERNKFIDRVDRFLQTRDASILDTLRVSFPLDEESASRIDGWLKSAAVEQITKLILDFDFRSFGVTYDSSKAYKFPFEIFAQSSLRHLSLKSCIFNFPPNNFNGFNSLISLTLRYIELSEHDVPNILSSCSSLEKFDLHWCYFPDDCCLQFSGPSLVLKHLSCRGCEGIEEITIHDINILSIELGFDNSYESKLSIKNAPNLARLVLASYSGIEIMCDIPRLEILFLSTWFGECILNKLGDLKNLKQLVVHGFRQSKINLLEMIYLLETCPLLQKLELNMGASIETDEILENIRTRPGGVTNNLKEVDVYGFETHPTKIEFVKYLLKNATVLEMMKISTDSKVYHGNGTWIHYKRPPKQEGIASNEIHQLFQKEVRCSTKFIIDSDI